MDKMANENKGRAKVKEFLRKKGKDPEKFFSGNATPESSSAGAAPSAEKEKATENQETEEQRKNRERQEAEKEAQRQEQELLEAKDETLSEDDKKRKKDLIRLKAEEKEAKREAGIQKRFDELTGELKALKNEKHQDKEKIASLEKELGQLNNRLENPPEKKQQELERVRQERISRYIEEDKNKPREQRREMSEEELEEWMVEDLVKAQTWLVRRENRRDREFESDTQKDPSKPDNEKVQALVKKQRDSQTRALAKHPELDITARQAELKAQGKTENEIRETIYKENPKARLVGAILKENPDKYLLAEDGPEQLVAEMEKRLTDPEKKSETAEEREARIRDEAAEAERQRQEELDNGLNDRGGGSSGGGSSQSVFEKENPAFFKRQLEIWKRQFPKESEASVKARLIKRLETRRAMGAS
jgi:hypothetical protein